MNRITCIAAGCLLLAGCTTIQEPFQGYYDAVRINREVNAKIHYTYDSKHRGTPRIMEQGGSGKCGDFALTKCDLLVKAGFNPNRLAFVWYEIDPDRPFIISPFDQKSTTHAVCVIDGEWAMDWNKRGLMTKLDEKALWVKPNATFNAWQPKNWPY